MEKTEDAGHARLGRSGCQPNHGAGDSTGGDGGVGADVGRVWTKEEEEGELGPAERAPIYAR